MPTAQPVGPRTFFAQRHLIFCPGSNDDCKTSIAPPLLKRCAVPVPSLAANNECFAIAVCKYVPVNCPTVRLFDLFSLTCYILRCGGRYRQCDCKHAESKKQANLSPDHDAATSTKHWCHIRLNLSDPHNNPSFLRRHILDCFTEYANA